jgi:radical SAM superfamily enzyme YgiQ (UPF0313 family)
MVKTMGNKPLSKSVLLVVLPYRPEIGQVDTTKKKVFSYLAFPYGALTIASYVKRFANNLDRVEILDLNLDSAFDPSTLLEWKLDEGFDIVGFSMSFDNSYKWMKSLVEIIRVRSPGTCIIAGGPAVTTAYEEILSECDLDACCYAEGEVAMRDLIENDAAVALAKDPWVTRDKLHAKTVYGDLDEIINVDYSLVDIKAYSMQEAFSPFMKYNSSSKQFFIVTSRGCPFKCVFCAEPSFHGAGMRYVSVDKVVDHVALLQDRYGLSVLTIYDDQILMNKVRAKELFRKLTPLKIRVEMPNGVTLSYIDEEMAEVMKAGGVDTLYLAIEHGSQRVLRDIIKKPISYKRIGSTIALLQKVGIYCQGFFVIGLPGETRAERQETRDAIIEWGLDWASFNYATPLRGSELFHMCKANGWIDPKHLPIGAIDMTRYVIKVPGMDQAEIEDFVFNSNLDVNFVHNHRMRIGDYETAYNTFREVVKRYPEHPFAHYYLAACEGELTGNIHRSWAEYRRIISNSPEWYDTAKRFGLEMVNGKEATDRTYPGRVRDPELRAHQSV